MWCVCSKGKGWYKCTASCEKLWTCGDLECVCKEGIWKMHLKQGFAVDDQKSEQLGVDGMMMEWMEKGEEMTGFILDPLSHADALDQVNPKWCRWKHGTALDLSNAHRKVQNC